MSPQTLSSVQYKHHHIKDDDADRKGRRLGKASVGFTSHFLAFGLILLLFILNSSNTNSMIRSVHAASSSRTMAGIYRHLTEIDSDASNLFFKDVRGGGCADPRTGDIFICDEGQYKVFKISASSNIASHFAGNGYQSTTCTSTASNGPCGNNIKATEAGLKPHTCAVDPVDSSVYIVDLTNSNIKKVNQTSGTISLFYGNGLNSQTLSSPHTIAVSSNFIVVMESNGAQIIKLDRATGSLLAKYGDGTVGYRGDGGLISDASVRFQLPGGVAVSPDGLYVYISDKTNQVIRRWNTQTNMITRYAGTNAACSDSMSACGDGGSALLAPLNFPLGLAVLPNGDLVFSDSVNYKIRKIDFVTGIITTVIGSGNNVWPSAYYFSIGPNGDGQIGTNVKIFVSNVDSTAVKSVFSYGTTIYFTEKSNRLRMLKDGIVTCIAGTHESTNGFGNKMINTQFKINPKVAFTKNGTMYVMADSEIFQVLPGSTIVQKIAGGYSDPTAAAVGFGAGNLAKYSQIYKPKTYMAIDQSNNDIYFIDNVNIKKIEYSTGIMSIYAGGGASYANNVAATATSLAPTSIALTPNNDLIIATDKVVRQVTKSTGIITTIAGTQVACSSGNCGDGGSPLSATLTPQIVAVNANNEIFVADISAYTIRKISANRNTISTYAGSRSSCSTQPCGDGGLATSATFVTVNDMAIHPITNELYFCDSERIRKISSTGYISTVVGNGVVYANKGEASNPLSPTSAKRIAFSPSGTLYFDDASSSSYSGSYNSFTFSAIRYLDANGNIATASGHFYNDNSFYNGENTVAWRTKLMRPAGLFIDTNGDIYIGASGGSTADSELFASTPSMNYARIAKFDANTGRINTILGNFLLPTASSQTADNTYAYQASLKIQDTYQISGIQFPFGLAKSSTTGEIYYSESEYHRIRKIDSNNKVITVAGTSTACTPASGTACGDNGAPLSATLNFPTSIVIVGTKIYFCDTMNHRVRMINNNVLTTVIGEGTECTTAGSATCDNTNPLLTKLSKPTGLYVTSDGSTIYVADTGNHKIRKLSSGTMSIVAGTTSSCSTAASCGSNVQADGTSAKLYYPTGVSIDESTNTIYIADQGTQTIRKVSSNIITTYAGTFTLFSSTSPSLYGFDGSSDYISKPVNVWYSNLGVYYTESKTGRLRMVFPTCPQGKVGMNCDMDGCNAIPTSSPLVCSTHGTCSAGVCTCSSGYYGTDCQNYDPTVGTVSNSVGSGSSGSGNSNPVTPVSYSCYSIASTNTSYVCSGHGNCTATDTCSCSSGYYGSTCSITTCNGISSNASNVCSSKGSCVDLEQCQCQANYLGSNCEITTCNSVLSSSAQVCNGKGSCSTYNNCNCLTNYFGTNCELTTCNSVQSDSASACNSHGQCISHDICQCSSNYLGNNCEITTCNSLLSNDSSVCSRNGVCTSFDHCSCNSNYIGSDCSITSCNGVLSNSSNVCSGHGQCYSHDNCLCNNNYLGTNCEITICNSILSNSSDVCSGHGQCTSFDSCNCAPHYHGSDCELTTCNQVESTNSSVCSGNGNCSDYNTCTCQDGFYGAYCSQFKCNGVLNTDSNVCNGNGSCLSTDTCNCTEGYYGQFCENRTQVIGNEVIVDNSTLANVSLVDNTTVSTNISIVDNSTSNSNVTLVDNSTITDTNNTNISNGSISGLNETLSASNETSTNETLINDNSTVSVDNSTINDNSSEITNTTSVSDNSTEIANNSTADSNSTVEIVNNTTIDNGKNNTLVDNSTVANETNVENSTITDNSTLVDNSTSVVNETVNESTNQTNIANETVSDNSTTPNQLNETISDNSTLADNSTIDSTDSNNTLVDNSTLLSNTTENDNDTLIDNNSTINDNSTETFNSSTSNNTSLNETSPILSENSTIALENNTVTTNETVISNITNDSSNITMNNSTINETLNETSKNETIINNSTNVPTDNSTAITNSTTTIPETPVNNSTSISACTKAETCSNHGECNVKGFCTCYSNSDEGYWTGTSCTTCQNGYYGESCMTRIVGPIRMTSDFRGVEFYLHSPAIIGVDVPCSKLLHPSDLSNGIYGASSLVKCQFIDKTTSLFRISFGSMDYNIILSVTSIRLNTLTFNQISTDVTNYLSFVILPPLSIAPPQAVIKMRNVDIYSSCDEISVDGSASFSADGKTLIYTWSLYSSNGTQIVDEILPNQAIISLTSNLAPGLYFITLFVKSSYLGISSSVVYSNIFTKSSKPLPSLVVSKSFYEKYSNEFPFTIKKMVSEASCQSTDTIGIEWIQTSGPSIDYQVDSAKNLLISSLRTFGSNSYIFKVSAFYISNPTARVSSLVTLNTKSPDLSLELHILQSTSESSTIEVMYSDPESAMNTVSTETWSWNSTNNLLDDYLLTVSNSKATLVIISTSYFNKIPNYVDFTLTIAKSDGRSIAKSIRAYFVNIPPVLNVLSVEPSTSYILSGNTFSMQTLVSSQSSTVNNTWFINGQLVDTVSETTSTSTVIIDTSLLPEGSTNNVQISSYDSASGATSTASYTFQVATTPKPCLCEISPTEGIALDTNFIFSCVNCQNAEKTIDFNYGFVDDRSGTKIPLYNLGEIYSSKIPSPSSGKIVKCYIDIVDTKTGASVTSYYDISITTPVYSTVQDIESLVQVWTDTSVKLSDSGDISKSISQSAYTSRTDAILVMEYINSQSTSRRSISTTCKNGVEIGNQCECADGYVGKNCDISIVEFALVQKTTVTVLNMMVQLANISGVTDDYISLVGFGLDSILLNIDSLSSEVISQVLINLNSVLQVAMSSELKIDNAIIQLFENCIKSIYTYLSKKKTSEHSSSSLKLISASKTSNFLTSRSLTLGGTTKNKKGDFYSVATNRRTVYDYESKIVDPYYATSIELDKNFLSKASKVSLMKKPFSYIMITMEDVYGLNGKLATKEQYSSQFKDSRLISHIVSFNVVDNEFPIDESEVYYTFPINKTTFSNPGSFLDLEIVTANSSYSCVDFTDKTGDLSTNCKLVKIYDDIATCKCSRFTNVFIVETTSRNVFSLSNYLILGVAIYIVLCLAIAATIAFCCIMYCINKRKRKTVPLYSSTTPVQTMKPQSQSYRKPQVANYVYYSNEYIPNELLFPQQMESSNKKKLNAWN